MSDVAEPLTPEQTVAALRDLEVMHRNVEGFCVLDGERWPCLHKATLTLHIANDFLAAASPGRSRPSPGYDRCGAVLTCALPILHDDEQHERADGVRWSWPAASQGDEGLDVERLTEWMLSDDATLRETAAAFLDHVNALACDHESNAGTHTGCPEALTLRAALAAEEERG